MTKGQCIYPFCFQILKMNIFYLNYLCFSCCSIFCLQLFFSWFWVQENEETNKLKLKLEDLSQMYESTVDELQTVKLDYDDLLHQKV